MSTSTSTRCSPGSPPAAPTTQIAEVLLDQRLAAGIGNVYKNEVLWACEVNPFRALAEIDEATRRRLYETAATQLQSQPRPLETPDPPPRARRLRPGRPGMPALPHPASAPSNTATSDGAPGGARTASADQPTARHSWADGVQHVEPSRSSGWQDRRHDPGDRRDHTHTRRAGRRAPTRCLMNVSGIAMTAATPKITPRTRPRIAPNTAMITASQRIARRN